MPSYPTAEKYRDPVARDYRDPSVSTAPIAVDSVSGVASRVEEALKSVLDIRHLADSLGNRLLGPQATGPSANLNASTGLAVTPPLIHRANVDLDAMFNELSLLRESLTRLDNAL